MKYSSHWWLFFHKLARIMLETQRIHFMHYILFPLWPLMMKNYCFLPMRADQSAIWTSTQWKSQNDSNIPPWIFYSPHSKSIHHPLFYRKLMNSNVLLTLWSISEFILRFSHPNYPHILSLLEGKSLHFYCSHSLDTQSTFITISFGWTPRQLRKIYKEI